jgi:hypothetical protein
MRTVHIIQVEVKNTEVTAPDGQYRDRSVSVIHLVYDLADDFLRDAV